MTKDRSLYKSVIADVCLNQVLTEKEEDKHFIDVYQNFATSATSEDLFISGLLFRQIDK